MRRILVTGFGPFADVMVNASEHLAHALAARFVGHDEVAMDAMTLETAFGRARARLFEHLGGASDVRNDYAFVLALGVARTPFVRLERLARAEVTSPSPDVGGEVWAGRRLGEQDLTNRLPLEVWAERAGSEGVAVEVSDDCGGYVCNAINHAVLAATGHESRGSAEGSSAGAGLFVHVPADAVPGCDRFAAVLVVLERLIALALERVEIMEREVG